MHLASGSFHDSRQRKRANAKCWDPLFQLSGIEPNARDTIVGDLNISSTRAFRRKSLLLVVESLLFSIVLDALE
jgi:hypothetical protein